MAIIPKKCYIFKKNNGSILHWDDLYQEKPFPENTFWLHTLYLPDLLWNKTLKDAKKSLKNYPDFFKDCSIEKFNREEYWEK